MSVKTLAKKMDEDEPLLIPNPRRYTILPIVHEDVWFFYLKQTASLWSALEIPYSDDMSDWNSLDDDERYFIENILAFFAGSDGLVMDNLMKNFATEIQWPEACAFYAAQGYIEMEHSHTYSLLIDTFVRSEKRKAELFNAINTIPCIIDKAAWAKKWMDPTTRSLAHRMIGFICVEGVFFSGAFCSIFWLKSRNLMTKALGKSNEMISRDENLHCEFGILMYSHIKNKLSEDEVHTIFREAVEIEENFICNSIKCSMLGMNSKLMLQYIQCVADIWIAKLGYKTIYNVENPFNFMNMLDMDGKNNFFESRTSEYSTPYSETKADARTFDDNIDF